MSRLPGEHTVGSALRRLIHLLRTAGVGGAGVILISAMDDKYLRSFDRRHRVQTSGFLRLAETGFDRTRLPDATQYAPVSGWGFRRFLKELNLPRHLRFVDLGAGLGRACLLAAEYGFSRVIGVELAPELCAGARRNVASFRPSHGRATPVEILQMDVLEYCSRAEDDVIFMFRPFSGDFFRVVLDKIVARARAMAKPLTVIYSERMAVPGSFKETLDSHPAFRKIHEAGIWGQAFYVYQCGSEFSPAENRPPAR